MIEGAARPGEAEESTLSSILKRIKANSSLFLVNLLIESCLN